MQREHFARLVKEALNNLYDPVYAQTHPLADLLAWARQPSESKGETLRRVLREAIEALKPSSALSVARPEWLGYRLLWLHYIRSLSASDTWRELSISESTFFRQQRQALEAVADVLWDKYRQHVPPEEELASPSARASLVEAAMQHALELVSEEEKQPVDLDEVAADVLRTLEPLARQKGISLQLDIPYPLPRVHGHPTILRQIFLNLLVEGLKQGHGMSLTLRAGVTSHAIEWRLDGFAPGDWQHVQGLDLTQQLLRQSGGRLVIEEQQGRRHVLVTLPIPRQRIILMVDDDPDAGRLYRRILQHEGYILWSARTWEQAERLLEQAIPDLVLLDVIMPGHDGWAILRQLKQCSQTAAIPVVVCSVIAQPELAVALGAAAVLSKPFTAQDLLRLVQAWLEQADSAEAAHPGLP